MQPISLHIRGVNTQFSGEISGQRIQSALAFAFSTPSGPIAAPAQTPQVDAQLHWQDGTAELEGRAITISVAHGADASFFRSTEAEFWVCATGEHAELTRCEGDPTVWLFGPLLILALARRNIFCLHGSAVRLDAGALLVIGKSGAGKSTFARAVSNDGTHTRLCDDISPLTQHADVLRLLPQFPQLKLAQADLVPASVSVWALLCLQAARAGETSSINTLSSQALHRHLLAHTVASRLFSAQDNARWWAALARWCEALDGRAFVLQPAFDASTPDRAMLNALNLLAQSL